MAVALLNQRGALKATILRGVALRATVCLRDEETEILWTPEASPSSFHMRRQKSTNILWRSITAAQMLNCWPLDVMSSAQLFPSAKHSVLHPWWSLGGMLSSFRHGWIIFHLNSVWQQQCKLCVSCFASASCTSCIGQRQLISARLKKLSLERWSLLSSDVRVALFLRGSSSEFMSSLCTAVKAIFSGRGWGEHLECDSREKKISSDWQRDSILEN